MTTEGGMRTFEYQYLVIEEQPRSSHRKTPVFAVMNRSQDMLLGTIQWYGAWRQYVFEPAADTVWSLGCLRDVEDALGKIKELP